MCILRTYLELLSWVSTAEYLQLPVNSEYSGVLENQGTAWQGNLQFPATLSIFTYENTSKLKMSSRDLDVAAPTSQLGTSRASGAECPADDRVPCAQDVAKGKDVFAYDHV